MMNYVGSVSILDRGDAPAQAILDKNARSLAQRVADETKEELEKVMNRVETIYESYEQSTQALYDTPSSLEYVEDIFFMDNSKSYEEEDWYPGTPDVDLDDVSQKIEDSLETAGELAQRLGQLNQEMVDWLSNYAITKASNK
ncbi:hypothetical protein KUTeg_011108 [Tegillarca granosa]|uniref:Uncharacterized protein n=1 Tax=Tegillarca granosa TaxID=220873 RepID=A0ABQ9F2Y9_TEGGR|nr:hypothetical protein KUTeg_011108 [Tegillarca granosa]